MLDKNLSNKKSMGKAKLLIMIVTTVFSFTSMSNAFFLKGYSAIPWFVISAFTYFVPYCFIIADLTSVYKDKAGGIYSWLKDSTSQKLAFVTTLMWYSSYFIWMISLCMKTWIPLSIMFFGDDWTKNDMAFGNIPMVMIIALLSICLVIIISLIALGGFKRVMNLSYISGRFMLILMAVVGICGAISLFYNNGHLAEGFQPSNLFKSQGEFQSIAENFSFFIFGITAFGGLDTVACLVNETGDMKKKFSKYILISGGIIISLYILGIFLWGASIDLGKFLKEGSFHLGNIMYGLVGQLSLNMGEILNLSQNTTNIIYQVFIRLTAITLFTSYISLLSIISTGPLLAVTTSLKETRLKKYLKWESKNNLPIIPIIVQGALLSLFILGISVFQKSVGHFYNQLTMMTNISRSIPYLLLALSYPAFKKIYPKNELLPFCNSRKSHILLSFSVSATVILSIIFSIYEKVSIDDYYSAATLVIGPIIFALIGLFLFKIATRQGEYGFE